jgi:hypothetical protein
MDHGLPISQQLCPDGDLVSLGYIAMEPDCVTKKDEETI